MKREKNIIINDAVKYRIKDIEISSRPVGDNDNVYFLNTLKNINISKTPEGALLSIGEVEENHDCKTHPHDQKPETSNHATDRPFHHAKPFQEVEIKG